jgi:hypothetical protein
MACMSLFMFVGLLLDLLAYVKGLLPRLELQIECAASKGELMSPGIR